MFTEITILQIIIRIRKLALYLGIEFDEVIEWIRAYNNKTTPWEEYT